MAGFDPRDRGEVGAARGNAGYGGGGHPSGGGGFSKGMGGALARRSAVSSPSYEASLGNIARMGMSLAPGGGLISGVGAALSGNFGPGSGGYTGYGGMVGTPGSYDSTNRALQGQGMQGGGGYGQNLFNPIQYNAVVRGGMYQGGGNQQKLAQLGQGQMFMPQPQQAPQAPQMPVQQPMASQPGKMLSTGGQYGISQFRPGYDFLRGGIR